MQLGDARTGKLAGNIAAFSRTLRRAGVPVDASRIVLAQQALQCVDLDRKPDVAAALEAVLVSREGDRAVFRELFDAFFRDPELANKLLAQMLPRAEGQAERPRQRPRVREALQPQRAAQMLKPAEPDKEIDLDAAMTASDAERLRQADFNQLTASEYRLVERLVRDIRLPVPAVPSRRTRAGWRGHRVHWGHTLQGAMHTGGEVMALHRLQRRVQPLPLLVLVDVSGSMERYARLLLAFLHAATRQAHGMRIRRDVFAFGTHLTDLTPAFRLQDADAMLTEASRAIDDFAGGTRLGDSLAALRRASLQIASCSELDRLFDDTLALLGSEFDIAHAMLLIADERRQRLYTVASRGYLATGVGSEIAYGEGVIGVAAQHRTPIRINHFAADYGYGYAARAGASAHDLPLSPEIPFPGLPEPHSQLAVPLLAADRLLGVLYAESAQDLRFDYDDEDALVALCGQLAVAIRALQGVEDAGGEAPAAPAAPLPQQPAMEVRHYRADDSVFVDGDYLIKGVPGAILWKLLRVVQDSGRCQFTNRELRLAAAELKLPEITDNLEARLILLQRRLAERCPALAIEKTGRGQFCLRVGVGVRLVEA